MNYDTKQNKTKRNKKYQNSNNISITKKSPTFLRGISLDKQGQLPDYIPRA